MSKYKFIEVDETAKIINSNVDIERVKIWSGIRVLDKVLSRAVSIDDSIVVKSTLEENTQLEGGTLLVIPT